MNPSDSVLDHDDDLQWQAFCYVNDELSETERESFEQELFTNQEAREAVAVAVTLTDSVVLSSRAASQQSTTFPEPARSRFAVLRVVLVAAVLLVAVGVLFQGLKTQESPTQQPMQTKLFTPSETPLVAGLGELSEPKLELAHNLIDGWADSEAVVSTFANADDAQDTEDEEFADNEPEEETAEDNLAPPAWMLAALNLDKQPHINEPTENSTDETETPDGEK